METDRAVFRVPVYSGPDEPVKECLCCGCKVDHADAFCLSCAANCDPYDPGRKHK